MSADVCSLLDDILRHRRLQTWFQPLINLKEHRILGYEALVRGPSNSALHAPVKLFDAARRCGREIELELICRDVHIENFHHLGLQGQLFLNVNPLLLQHQDFPTGFTLRSLAKHGLTPDHLVIELTEQVPIHDYDLLRQTLAHYRNNGFAVAIDDLGAGYSGLRLWSELRPEFVKLDKHFIQGVDGDLTKRQFISSLQEIALGLGCTTIAEGIETPQEAQVVRSLGINIGQGYYFDRPSPSPLRELPETLPLSEQAYCSLPSKQDDCLCHLVQPVPVLSPPTRMEQAGELFERHPALWTLPVVDRGRPVGILRRHDFLRLFASRYGRDLYAREAVERFMDGEPLIVDQAASLEAVSKLVTARLQWQPGDDILVVEQGCYVGMVTVLALLRQITDLQVRNARYANPLTLLPGNVPINETLSALLAAGVTFAACYIDLDHFKPFNDYYDYQRGDTVLQMLAELLRDEAHPDRDFVGHIGGDDFMVVFQSADWQLRCQRILKRFSERIPLYYDGDHRAEGGIHALNRAGETVFYPLMTLSIGVTCAPLQKDVTCHEMASYASEAKRMAKASPGNALFIDRRSHQQPELVAIAPECPHPFLTAPSHNAHLER